MKKMNASPEKGHNTKHYKAQFPQGTNKGQFHQNISLYLLVIHHILEDSNFQGHLNGNLESYRNCVHDVHVIYFSVNLLQDMDIFILITIKEYSNIDYIYIYIYIYTHTHTHTHTHTQN
jgi:hypothetical protein